MSASHDDSTQAILRQQLRRCILPLAAVTREAKWHGLGTAFVVSVIDGRSALLLTAAHNLVGATRLDPYVPRPATRVLEEFVPATDPQLGATKIYSLTADGSPARMQRAWWRAGSDVAILYASLSDHGSAQFDMRLPINTTSFLATGQAITAVGFTRFDTNFKEPPNFEQQQFSVSINALLEFRHGDIAPSPLAQPTRSGYGGTFVTCPFDSGMSGGPVLAAEGGRMVARAVVSRDLSDGHDTAKGSGALALAEWIAPVLDTRLSYLEVQAPSGLLAEPTLRQLIGAGVVEDLAAPDGE